MELTQWLNSKLKQDIWIKKYQFEDETLDQFFERIAGDNKTIEALIREKKFMPAGRILANRGLYKKGKKITYSNCYVATPPEDSIESIFECATKVARTFSYGGGIGVDFSKLSPRGAKLNNAAKETTGAVSFMDLYSMITGLISQNGRRGALMLSLTCDHPDLLEFINIKSDLTKVTKANISIKITDAFMQAVIDNTTHKLSFYREETGEVIEKIVDAREIFEKICYMNWNYAEPGFLMWDRIEKWNLLSEDVNFKYAGVNPCAEECLPAGGSCLLSSINLSEFIIDPFTETAYFDHHSFANVVMEAIIYLNEILDEGMPLHPLAEQRESVEKWRQCGLGVMGIADALIKLNIRYGSKESIELCDQIGYALINYAVKQSALLAKKYGSYPAYNQKAVFKSEFFNYNINDDIKKLVKKYGLRNSQLLTTAPTGSISTMLGISGGIEPMYEISYTRKTESLHGVDTYYEVYTSIVEELLDYYDFDKDNLPEFLVTSQTLNYKERIDMQAVWQTHIDASISSTVNVPESFSVEDVKNLYIYAWQKGLKGVTIYRNDCEREGILSTSKVTQDLATHDSVKKSNDLKWGTVIESKDNLIGRKRKLTTGCGSLHCTAFFDPESGRLMETYLSKGSTGGCLNSLVGLSRMISLAARNGSDIYGIVDQLNSCGVCPSYAVRRAKSNDVSQGSCCPVAVSKALIDMYNEIQDVITTDWEIVTEVYKPEMDQNKCPVCSEQIAHINGCITCISCGYSKCD